MEAEEYISHIRDKAQADISTQRSLKRSLLFNSRRANLDQIEQKTELPSLQQFTELCSRYISSKKPQELQRVRIALCGGQQYISVFLAVDGALYTLIGSLTGGNAKLQLEALYCFINIGFGTQKQCIKVCEKAGSYLILLGSDNPQLQELCLWAFGNFCGSHPKVCSIARHQGLEPALRASLASKNENVVQSAAYTMNHYLNAAPYRIRDFCTPDTVRLVMEALKKDKDATKDLCWCAYTISTSKDVCDHLVNFRAVNEALQLLSQVQNCQPFDVCVATSLVRLLTNIVAVMNNVSIEICYKADIFVPICNLLLQSSYPHLHEETIQLIANVVNGAGCLPLTGVKILEDSNLKARLEPALKQNFASHFVPREPQILFS